MALVFLFHFAVGSENAPRFRFPDCGAPAAAAELDYFLTSEEDRSNRIV
jgi:hypothetical protein